MSIRAKVRIDNVQTFASIDRLNFVPVQTVTDANGKSRDNTFAKHSPSLSFSLDVSNEDLRGAFKPGQVFFLELTETDIRQVPAPDGSELMPGVVVSTEPPVAAPVVADPEPLVTPSTSS